MTQELKNILGTELYIGKIDIGLLNRVIIDDVLLNDQLGKEMLKVTRLSAKFEILPLLKGKITISSVQLFGFNVCLSKENPQASPNFKFVLDALTSNDSIKQQKNIDLRINSILVRRGKLSYDVLSEPETPGKFNTKHVKLQNLIANISLKALSNDSINGFIKRLSFDEQSGFELDKLSMKILANKEHFNIENFTVGLPHTNIKMDTIRVEYDSLDAFKYFTDKVRFKGKMHSSTISLKDISCFVPALSSFSDKLNLNLEFNGTVNQLNCPKLEINAGNNIKLSGNVSFQDLSRMKDAYVFGNLSQVFVSEEGLNVLFKNLSKNKKEAPDVLKRMGKISFHGEVSGYFNDLVTYGMFYTDIGTIKTDVKISTNREEKTAIYTGLIKTDKFELGKLLAKEELVGKITFNLDIKAVTYKNRYPEIDLDGLISSVRYSNYTYENIELDGKYNDGGFDGKISLNDPNGVILLNGSFNPTKKIPVFNFEGKISKVRPHALNLTKKYDNSEFSLNIGANFSGSSIDNMIGEVNIDSLLFISPEKQYFLDNLNLKAMQNEHKKFLIFNSEFMTATVQGNFSYHTLPASLFTVIERYIPSLLTKIPNNKIISDNNFNFDVDIRNTDILSDVFNIPFNVYTRSTIKGYFNEHTNKLRLEGYFPTFKYGNTWYESGMILCENPSEQLHCRMRATSKMKNSSMLNLSLDAYAQNDELKTIINWGNNAETTYSGKFSAVTNFFKTEGEKPILQAAIDIQPTKIILNDSIWNIHSSHISVDSGRVFINDFLFEHKDQFLHIKGKLTKNIEDTIKVDLNKIDIGYVFDIANLKSVDFTGLATGVFTANQVLKSPVMNTRLFVENFAFNRALIGDMNIYGTWDKEQEGIYLDAYMKEGELANTRVKGYIFPKKKGLDLNIEAGGTNISFIEHYMKNIASDIKGRARGNVHFFGGFKSLTMAGSVYTDASLKINILNSTFIIKDSLRFTPEKILFNNVEIADNEEHRGKMNGYLSHEHFKNLKYRFDINVNNMLVYNTKENMEIPFYGTVYATGNALLNGGAGGLNVDVAMSTNRNTNFVYTTGSTSSAINNQFITFIDRTPKREIRDSVIILNDYIHQEKDNEDPTPIDIRLNLQIDATPDATMKIIIDPVAGDYISGRGNGNIRVDFFNKGDVKMFGNYTLDQGMYKFSLQEVIRKDFIIKSGSTISFNGYPLDANLDILAAYTVNSASLNDLGLGETFTQNNVKVNCVMNLTGNLLKPSISFDIELPNVNEEERELVKTAISTEEQMNMQILYLLGIGKFYTYNYGNNADQQSSNAMTSVLSSTLSGQLNNMLSQVINSSNWNFGTNLSTGDKGWTDMEFEGILSGQLLNNRLLLNGNFGYRDNPMSNSNFVGDFDIEYLLTRSGDIRLKAYNQTNDNRYFTKSSITTQGIGLIYKKDFNTWRDLLTLRSRRKSVILPTDTIKKDSVSSPQSRIKRERN